MILKHWIKQLTSCKLTLLISTCCILSWEWECIFFCPYYSCNNIINNIYHSEILNLQRLFSLRHLELRAFSSCVFIHSFIYLYFQMKHFTHLHTVITSQHLDTSSKKSSIVVEENALYNFPLLLFALLWYYTLSN